MTVPTQPMIMQIMISGITNGIIFINTNIRGEKGEQQQPRQQLQVQHQQPQRRTATHQARQ